MIAGKSVIEITTYSGHHGTVSFMFMAFYIDDFNLS